MFTSGQRKQLAIRKPQSPHEHLMGACVRFSTMDHIHVCSTCGRETVIQTEEDVPAGNLSPLLLPGAAATSKWNHVRWKTDVKLCRSDTISQLTESEVVT